MNTAYAIEFLRNNQPLPNDDIIDENTLEIYNTILHFFQYNIHNECVPLILNSFGGWNGYGVYQMVEETIRKYSKEIVMPHLLKALKSENVYTQYWCCQIAEFFFDEQLIIPLTNLINTAHEEVQQVAAITLDGLYFHLYRIETEFYNTVEDRISNK